MKRLSTSLIFLAVFMLFSSCNQDRTPGDSNTPAGETPTEREVVELPDSDYILSHTAGIVSRDQAIEIHLSQDILTGKPADSELPDGLLRFTPKIAGKLILKDHRTLLFQPEEKMAEDREYKAELQVASLFEDVPESKSLFQFSFKTMAQNYEVTFEPLIMDEEGRGIVLKGSIVTADDTETEQIEQILSLPRMNREASTEWSHEGRIHIFTISGIEQREDVYYLEFSWDGKPIGVSSKGSTEITIPGKAAFVLNDYRIHLDNGGNYLALYFSNPVAPDQNLKGLIELNNSDSLSTAVSGNTIKIYPKNRIVGEMALTIHKGIKNTYGDSLKKAVEIPVAFYAEKPALKMINESGIYTGDGPLQVPFEAISLRAVDVQIIRIYEDNMPRFFQFNKTMKENRNLTLVGRPVFQGSIELSSDDELDLYSWNRYSIDLSSFIEEEPGALYRVYINMRRSQSLYPGSIQEGEDRDYMDALNGGNWDGPGAEKSYWDYYSSDYNWRDRDNPTTDSYYSQNRRRISMALLSTDMGMIAKGEKDNRIHVILSSLQNTDPISGAEVIVYNYQLIEIGRGSTDSEGHVTLDCEGVPFLVSAKKGVNCNYLRVDPASALSLSSFDVTGTNVAGGIKGFLYGERGIWRPGDPIYLTFVLEDKEDKLPNTIPAVMELINPSGQTVQRVVNRTNLMGIYRFNLTTEEEAPTGTWIARVRVGDYFFEKSLPIETVKPNRLKVILTPDVEKFTRENSDGGRYSATLTSRWLHGAPARNLKAKIEVALTPAVTRFDGYPDYTFDDPTLSFSEPKRSIFDGKLDNEGNADVRFNLESRSVLPGSLTARFQTRVFEEGGNFSINQVGFPYYPYDSYVGLRTPPGDKSRGMLLTDEDHTVDIVTLNGAGEPVSREGVSVKLYKIRWRWWWNKSSEDLSDYMNLRGTTPISEGTVNTTNGKGSWTLRVDYPSWGRYLLVAKDPQSGHRSSRIIYMDWPGWAGSPQRGGDSASILSIYADKKNYTVGESVTLSIPSTAGSRALVSIEKGSQVVDSWWVETEDKMTEHVFPVTAEMSPTAYIHVTLVQPVEGRNENTPLRMFGITPIQVKDPATVLSPQISMDRELKPEKSFSLTVSEESGQAMAYTLAVVDEGLLDLTNFPTPNPWSHFYGKEALSVRTWDLYNEVIGRMNGEFGTLLAPGGSDSLDDLSSQEQNRFRPVVIYEGPFELKAGESRTHVLNMPSYVGSVRTMVIATNGKGGYGRADNTTPVKQNLMVQGTLPRLVGPEETFSFPVTLFTPAGSTDPVKVTLETEGNVSVEGQKELTVTPDETGETNARFTLRTGSGTEEIHIKATADNGSLQSVWETDLEIRLPNQSRTRMEKFTVDPGETVQIPVNYFGTTGTNSAFLEVSSLPPINMERRLKWLIRYPHGCIEQTTSSVFPQLFLTDLKDLTPEQQAEIQRNVEAGIQRLTTFQLPSGGLSYWPGGQEETDWGTTYAGHFLLEAKNRGYHVPQDMLDKWIDWQKDRANRWDGSDSLNQAYRLYTLSLAGKSQSGAMNRLKEKGDLDKQTQWRLAAAYALDGKDRIALTMVEGLDWTIPRYRSTSRSYGSALRDKAMILETLTLLGEEGRAYPLLEEMSLQLSSDSYMSTQTLSYSLIAVGKYARLSDEERALDISYKLGSGAEQTLESSRYSVGIDLTEQQRTVELMNRSEIPLFLELALSGSPAAGNEQAEEQGVSLTVEFLDSKGKKLDPKSLPSGTDLTMVVKVTNPNDFLMEEMALTTLFPSGWEILNTRMTEGSSGGGYDVPEYQDFRDDRVYTYFDLEKKGTSTFVFYLNAAYEGSFYFPGILCESMYNMDVYSHGKGFPVEVRKN
ncbi:MAG: MG2 domain-containing protein [Spirochaetales bacterium]|nr:MG2 domain-containing protein [Spirochaetales bacterium]